MRGDAGRSAPPADVATRPSLVLRLEPSPPPAVPGGRRVVVTDTAWSAPTQAAEPLAEAPTPPIALGDVAADILGSRDLIGETTELLDGWAAATGVVDALTSDGTSFWFYYRLREWAWLQELVLWLAIADALVDRTAPGAIEIASGVDAELVDAIRLVAARRGIDVRVEGETNGDLDGPPTLTPTLTPAAPASGPATPASGPATRPRARSAVWLRGRVRWLRHGVVARVSRDEPSRRRRLVRSRLGRLARERGRLLVVLEHARQRIETPTGPRDMNPYLGPVVDRLRGTRLEPIEIDIRARIGDDESWTRVVEPGVTRLLPLDAVGLAAGPPDPDGLQQLADGAADRIARSSAALVVDGIDVGPLLAGRLAGDTRRTLAGILRASARTRRLIRRLRPAGILLADEYHRQEWLAAGAAEGVPVAAVQHGLIWRGHAGYVHPDRPAALRLPDRTYVFGAWEAGVLRERSVYRRDEVVVGGSPRLDLAGDPRDDPDRAGREAVRAGLGVTPSDRVVVVSGTWSRLYRRFHYPVGLCALVDRPLPGVHIVIKLHPGEPDDGPYRAAIEGAARARGFSPPPVTVVRVVDLYRLLAAADAHVGIHSTVLTEAVWTGTRNLLLTLLPAADLLGYVDAGVAHPIRDGGDLLAALDDPTAGIADEATRRRFLDAHFEPGDAGRRIADDLLAWLP